MGARRCERELRADLDVRPLRPVPDREGPGDALGEGLDHRRLERAQVLQHLLHRVAEARHVRALLIGRELDEEVEGRVEEAAAVGEPDDAVEPGHARLIEPEPRRWGLLLHVALEARGQAPRDPHDAARLAERRQELGDGAPERRVPEIRRDVARAAPARSPARRSADAAPRASRCGRCGRRRRGCRCRWDAGRTALRGAAHPRLDPLGDGEQLGRLERGGALDDEVQEARLIGHQLRLGLVDRRDPLDPHVRAEALERFRQVGLAVSQVRSEAQVDDRRWRGHAPARPGGPGGWSSSR